MLPPCREPKRPIMLSGNEEAGSGINRRFDHSDGHRDCLPVVAEARTSLQREDSKLLAADV